MEFINYYEEIIKNIDCDIITDANIFNVSGSDLNFEISYKKNNEVKKIFTKKYNIPLTRR